jgi:outer membrane protein assembly factor BamE (lipoprotein component of BamABCDE complex)
MHFARHLRFFSLAILTAACAINGCYSSSSGTPIDAQKVSGIQKGVTTRSQVEGMLGQPTNVSMLGDGRRMMMYSHMEVDAHAKPTSYIPVVNMFNHGATGEQHSQTLQVILDKNDVVQDYEFNDSVKNIDSSGGIGGMHTEVTDAPRTQPSVSK